VLNAVAGDNQAMEGVGSVAILCGGRGTRLQESTSAIPSVVVDLTKQHELVGKAEIPWRDGFRRMVAARHPELLQG
jgi:hypothetical protein